MDQRKCVLPSYMPHTCTHCNTSFLGHCTAVFNGTAGHADGALLGLDKVPQLKLTPGNNSRTSPCATTPVLLPKLLSAMFGAASATGFYQLRILWQNPMGLGFFPCIANLSSVTSFGLTPDNVMSIPSAGDFAPAKLPFWPASQFLPGQHHPSQPHSGYFRSASVHVNPSQSSVVIIATAVVTHMLQDTNTIQVAACCTRQGIPPMVFQCPDVTSSVQQFASLPSALLSKSCITGTGVAQYV